MRVEFEGDGRIRRYHTNVQYDVPNNNTIATSWLKVYRPSNAQGHTAQHSNGRRKPPESLLRFGEWYQTAADRFPLDAVVDTSGLVPGSLKRPRHYIAKLNFRWENLELPDALKRDGNLTFQIDVFLTQDTCAMQTAKECAMCIPGDLAPS